MGPHTLVDLHMVVNSRLSVSSASQVIRVRNIREGDKSVFLEPGD